ncbi:MAG: glycosyltransferase [Bacteroidales bacterium]|nr:glycosyltransferase [Bacteroidales bacterium]
MQTHNFNDFCLIKKSNTSFASKKKIVFNLFIVFFKLLFNRKKLHKSNIIFSIGYATLIIAFFNKIHFIQCNRIYWWGFFPHNKKYLPVFRILIKFLTTDRLHLIVFSKFEKKQYPELIGIKNDNIHYIPYGEFNHSPESVIVPSRIKDYYFSGGYSNRDYVKLIDVFRRINKKLIIICSKNNKEILSIDTPANIEIFQDLSSGLFEKYLRESKVVIIPFKYNSGASGQSVMLRCMRNKKTVIVTRTDVIKDYVDDGISGIIIDDLQEELQSKIDYLEKDESARSELGENLYKKYVEEFSYEAIIPYLSKIINSK